MQCCRRPMAAPSQHRLPPRLHRREYPRARPRTRRPMELSSSPRRCRVRVTDVWVRQTAVCATLILAALFIQQAFLSRLGLPGSTPDLLLVTVIALALAYGPMIGAICGFSGGLLLDLSPSTAGTLGLTALIFLAIGFITGAVIDPRDRTVPILMGIVSLSTGAAVLIYALLSALLGSDRVLWEEVPALVLSAALYGLLLAPVIVLFVGWLVRRVTPEVAD